MSRKKSGHSEYHAKASSGVFAQSCPRPRYERGMFHGVTDATADSLELIDLAVSLPVATLAPRQSEIGITFR
jgi:hypothetical protein